MFLPDGVYLSSTTSHLSSRLLRYLQWATSIATGFNFSIKVHNTQNSFDDIVCNQITFTGQRQRRHYTLVAKNLRRGEGASSLRTRRSGLVIFLFLLLLAFGFKLLANVGAPQLNFEDTFELAQDDLAGNGLATFIILEDTWSFVDLLSEIFLGEPLVVSALNDGLADSGCNFSGWCDFVFAVEFGYTSMVACGRLVNLGEFLVGRNSSTGAAGLVELAFAANDCWNFLVGPITDYDWCPRIRHNNLVRV